jgi:hypothetical protein
MKRRHLVVALACVAAAAGACAKKKDVESKPMTTAERDSAIGESKLPGAGVVKKALEQSDSAKARAERANETP